MTGPVSPGASSPEGGETRISSTQAQNEFGRLVDSALGGQRIVITRRNAPKVVLLSYEAYRALSERGVVDLPGLTARFDALLDRMQSPGTARSMQDAFESSGDRVAEAAVEAARRAPCR